MESDTTTTRAIANVGPLFCLIDGLAYVRVTKEDERRIVVDPANGQLVKYAARDEYASRPVGLDKDLFCAECYGTTEANYTAALTDLQRSHSGSVCLVGTCCIYGSSEDESYPDSRKIFEVKNDFAFSGSCHPQPGEVLFMHKPDKRIGRVWCYWHVHGRSSAKTYLYTCAIVSDSKYAEGVVSADINKAFSLGTVGNSEIGVVTEECSLVTVPARPGCYCEHVAVAECVPMMQKLGFSTIKSETLTAGLGVGDVGADGTAGKAADVERTLKPESVSVVSELVDSFKTILRDQATEMTVLKDVLNALKIQNSLFTRLIANPNDVDIKFTLEGAKDFTRRTGIKTQLSAGIESTDEHTVDASRSNAELGTMALNQQHVEELIKLLQQQQSQQQQPMSVLQQILGDSRVRDVVRDAYGPPNTYTQFDPSRLSREQRQQIAMAYNREEDEKRAATQQCYDKMVESLKSGIKEMIAEQNAQQLDKLTTRYE